MHHSPVLDRLCACWRIARVTLCVTSIWGVATIASAATYYIDYSSGSDSNNGTSKNTPWKRHPYMAGRSGSYSHQAGDRFIFKGGVTWPHDCWGLNLHGNGGNASAYDYYGVDQTWFTGASWTRPKFDAQGTELPSGYDVMVHTYDPGVN